MVADPIAPTVITVATAQDLANAIIEINASQKGAYDVVIAPAGGDTITLDQDLPILNAGNASVTFDGGNTATTLSGQELYRGLYVQSGTVTVQNLTITDALAGGGDGGSGIAAGGGGAGLGGGLFVGAAATVSLNNVNFTDDVAAGGNGGDIDTTATAGGGGGGMGGAGGDAANTSSQNILNAEETIGGYTPPFNTSVDTLVGAGGGGGGGGLGTTATGSSLLNSNGGEGDAPGEASGGGGGGQTEDYQKTYFYGGYSKYGTDTSPSTGGGAYGGGGGFGNSEYSGGGGGGIGGQTSANFNTGQTVVVDETSGLESVLDEIYSIAKIALPLVAPEFGVAFAAINLITDITAVAESGGFTVADGIELGTDAGNLFTAASADFAAGKDLEEAEPAYNLPTTVRTLGADLRALADGSSVLYTKELLATYASKLASTAAKQALKLAEGTVKNLSNGDPLGTSLKEAAVHLIPLSGQTSDPTVVSSGSASVPGEPTAGGNGGMGGGGGGGGGVGGNGGYGGGGGGAGLPSTDADFDGGNGGFGGGGGGASLNAEGGTGGFGAGNGTNGYYYDPSTGTYYVTPSMGGGGLGAGGGVFVQQGGKLVIGGNVSFSGNAVAGGIAYNSGLGLGEDVFEAGGGILTVDPSAGQTTAFGDLTDENASETGYASDRVGLAIEGAGLVQLNGTNTFSDQSLIGTPSVADTIAANPAGSSNVVNGQLEITAGTTMTSNIMLEAGATLIVDAGATLTGSIDLSNILPGESYTLSIDPAAKLEGGIILPNAQDMSASTIAGVNAILADFAAQTTAALPSQPYVLGLNSTTDLQSASGTIDVPILPNGQPLTIRAEAGGGTLAASNLVLADPSHAGGGLILSETSAADTLTIDASISDANAKASANTPGYTDITVAGPGTTVLAGNNSFDGGVTLEAGTLDIDGNAHLGILTFAPTSSPAAPVVLSMALTATPTTFAYKFSDEVNALNETGTFDFNDPIELPNITPPSSPVYGYLTPNIGNDDVNSNFGVGVVNFDPDFVDLEAAISPYGDNPALFSSSFSAVLSTDSNGVAALSINPEAVEVSGFGAGTLSTGDSIEITNAAAPAQPTTLTSFAYNGHTLVAITLSSSDATGYIDFGTSIAPGTGFVLQAGANGVATLTLATTALNVGQSNNVIQSSDFSNALTAVTAAADAGTRSQSFVVTDNVYQVTLDEQTTQLGTGNALVIAGQGNEITTVNGPLSFDGAGSVAIEDATLNNTDSSAPLSYFYGIAVGSGTTVALDQVSVEQDGIFVNQGGVLDLDSTSITEPSGAIFEAILTEGTVNLTDSTISGMIEMSTGTLTLGDGNVVSGTISLDQTNATLFINPAAGATDEIDAVIAGVGSVVIGSASTSNGGLVVVAGANDYSAGTTIYADDTVDIDAGATLGTGTVTIVGDRTELPVLAEDATIVLDGGSLPSEIDVTAPEAVIDIAANSISAGKATLNVASGSALTVVGDGTTLDVSAASAGLDITGGGITTLEGFTLASTDGIALTIGDNAAGFGSDVTISGEILVDAGASLDIVSATVSAVAGGTALDIEGGTADLDDWQISGATVIAGGGTLTLGSGSLSNSVAIDTGSSLILSPTSGGTVTLAGLVSGDGTLMIDTPASVPGGLVEVTNTNSFSGNTIIEGENILEIAAGASLGTGPLVLAGPDATLRIDGTTPPTNAIDFSSGNGVVELTGLGSAAFQTVAVNASGHLNFKVGSANETLDIAGVATGTLFDVVGTGADTEVFLAAQKATVASGAALEAAVDGADAIPAAATGATDTIALAPGAGMLDVTQNENLSSHATVQIVDAAGAGAPATILAGPGVSLGLSGANSFAGGVEIGTGATLTLANPTAAGTGAITFVGTGGAELVTSQIVNTIGNFDAGDTLDVTGLAASAATVLVSLQGTVTFPAQTGNATYQLAGVAPETPISAGSDGHGGTLITTTYTQQVYTVSSEAELDAAITSINSISAGSDIAATIDFAPNADIKLTQSLATITLAADTILYINGNGGTLDGQGAHQGFAVAGAGTLTVANINIVNAVAQGGNNYGTYGGGGGAGLGGALFIGGTTQATILNIGFSGDAAVGGNAWVGNLGAGNGADAPSGVALAGFGQGSSAFSQTNGWGGGESGYLDSGLQDGGGGAGLGGALFVQSGASVTVAGALTEQGGAADGGNGIQSGFGFGAGIFEQGNGTLTFDPAAGTSIDIADAIADQSEPSVDIHAPQSAQVNVTMAGAGTLDLGGANSYGGTTTIKSGTVDIANPTNLSGAIADDSGLVFDPSQPSSNASLFAAGDQIDFADTASDEYAATIGGTGTLADLAAALLEDEEESGYQTPAFLAAYGSSGVTYNAQTGVIQVQYYGTAPEIYDADGTIGRLFEITQGPTFTSPENVTFKSMDLTLRGAQISFGQAITGSGDVTLDGAAGTALTLTGSAAWTGSTTIAAGNELTFAGPSVPSGAIDDEGTIDVANTAAISRPGFLANGEVIFSGASATLTSAITGSFGLSVDAIGTVSLDETSAPGALGALTVAGGTLDLTASTVGGPVTVSSGTLALSGNADIAQNVSVSGGTFAPSGGEILAGDVTLAGGTLSLAADTVAATGTIDFTGSATLIVNANAMPTGTIQNFLPGDTIVATGFDAATFAVSVNPTTDVMKLTDGLGHSATLQLDAGADPALYTYAFKSTAQGIAITPQLEAPTITGFSNPGIVPAGSKLQGEAFNAITGSEQQVITGQAAPGELVTLYTSPVLPRATNVTMIVQQTTANANGQWSISEQIPGAEDGFPIYSLSATATLANGLVSPLSSGPTLYVDTSTPYIFDEGNTPSITAQPFLYMLDVDPTWATVQVLSGNQVIGSVTETAANFNYAYGAITAAVPVTLTTFGSNALSVKITDYSGLTYTSGVLSTVIYDPQPAAPSVSLLDDTSGGHGITSNATIVGTAMPGSTVSDGYASTTVGAGGTFTLTQSLPDGAYKLQVTDTNVYGTVSSATPLSFTLETSTPAPSAYFVHGSSHSNLASTPLVTVSAEAGASVSVSSGGKVLATGTASSAGLFTFNLPSAGTYTLSLTSTDIAGNTATATSAPLLYDPHVPSVKLALAQDTGVSGDSITDDGVVNGTADPNTVVTIKEGNGVAPLTETTDASGNFSFTLSPSATQYGVTVSDSSLTGVAGTSAPLNVLVQPASLDQPTLQLVRISGTNGATNDPDLLVKADAGTTVTLSNGSTVIGTVAGTGGLTTFHPTLADGSYALTAVATNVSGAVSAASAPLDFTLETGSNDSALDVSVQSVVNAAQAAEPVAFTVTGPTSSTQTYTVEFKDSKGDVVSGAAAAGATTGTVSGVNSLEDGTVQILLGVTDQAGNAALLNEGAFLLDTTPDHGGALAVAIDPTSKGVLGPADEPSAGFTVSGMDADASGVAVFTDGTNTVTQSVASNGTYSANLTDFNGTISAVFTATDIYGNTAQTSTVVTAIITPPAAPIVSLAGDTGSSATDKITFDPALTVANVPHNGVVEYSLDDATFSTTQPTFTTDGQKSVYVENVDQAGNVSAATDFTFTLDTTPPAIAINDAAGDYTDASVGGQRTLYGLADGKLSGTTEASLSGSAVEIMAQVYSPNGSIDTDYPSVVVGSALVQADGSWTAAINLPDYTTIVGGVPKSLPGGGTEIEGGTETDLNHYSLTASVTDTAGNTGSTQSDYVTGTPPAVSLRLVTDTGASNSDGITNTVILAGTAEGDNNTFIASPYSAFGNVYPGLGTETAVPPGPIEIFDNSTLIDTIPITPNQTGYAVPFSVNVLDLPGVTIPDGVQTFSVVQTDAAGDVGAYETDSFGNQTVLASVTVDVERGPVVTAALDATAGPEAASGYVQHAIIDTTTTDTAASPVYGESSLPYVYSENGVVIATSPVQTATFGNEYAPVNYYSDQIDLTSLLGDGAHTIVVSQTDLAGNVSYSAPVTFTLQTKPPVLSLALADDTSNGQDITSDSEIAGNAGDATSVTLSVYAGAVLNVTLTPDAQGNFNYTVPAFSAETDVYVAAVATDAAGNQATDNLSFTQKTVGDDLLVVGPEGITAGSGTTIGTTIGANDPNALYVTAAPGTVTISDAQGVLGQVDIPADNSYRPVAFDLPTLPDGTYDITATETDVAGNVSRVDLAVTENSHVPVVTLGNASGAVSGQPTNNDVLAGTADPDAGVSLLENTSKTDTPDFVGVAYTTADASGHFSFTLNQPEIGTSYISAPNGGTFEAIDNYAPTGTSGSATFDLAYYSAADTAGAAVTAVQVPQPVNGVETDEIQYSVTLPPGENGGAFADTDTVTFTDTAGDQVSATGANGSVVPAGLLDGTIQTVLTLDDAAGNTATVQGPSFTLDATPPQLAFLTQGNDTNTTSHMVYGTDTASDAGQTVTISQIYNSVSSQAGTAVVAADGSWSLPVTLSSGVGVYGYSAAVTSPAGIEGDAEVANAFDLETAAPTVSLQLFDDTSNGNNITANPEVVANASEAGLLTIYNQGTAVLTYDYTPGSGGFTFDMTSNGVYHISATLTDNYGNTGTSAPLTATFDNFQPTTPTVSLVDDTSGGAGISSDLTITGLADPGDIVDFEISDLAGNSNASVTADSNGNYTYTPIVSTDSLVRIIADTTTAADQQSTDSTTFFYTADVTPPAVSVTLNDDTSNGAKVSSNPTLAVTTKPNSVVTFSEGGVQLGSVTAAATGLATFDPQGLSDGLQTITVQATDVAGLVGPATNFAFTLDTKANADGLLDLETSGEGNGLYYSYDVTDGSNALSGATVTFSDGYGDSVQGQPSNSGPSGLVNLSTLAGPVTATVLATDIAGNTAALTKSDVFTLQLQNNTSLEPGLLVTSAPILGGYAVPGTTVSLNDGAGVIATTTADGSGVFGFYKPSLANGTYTLTASGTDAEGNTDSDQLNVLVFDTDTTGATISISAPASTVTSHQFTVSGQASPSEAGNIVYLEAPNSAVLNSPYTNIVGYGTIRADGTWQVASTVSTDGTYSYEALVVAANGQQTESAAQSFVVQTAPANGVSITDGNAQVTGSDYVLTGLSSVPSAYLEIQLGNGEYTTFQASSSGSWSYDLPIGKGPGYLNGSNTFSPVVITAGANAITVSLEYTKNFTPISGATKAKTTLTVVPPEPVPVITSATTDQGQVISNGQAITDPRVTFEGTAEDNSTVKIIDHNGNVVGTASANSSGNWTYNDTGVTLPTGSNYFSATSVDSAGTTEQSTTQFGFTVYAVGGSAPAAPALLPASDSSGGLDITDVTAVTVTGNVPVGNTLTTLYLYDTDGTLLGQATESAQGNYSITTPNLAQGVHELSVVGINLYNETPASAPLKVTIDTTAPTVAASAPAEFIGETSAAGAPVTFSATASDCVDGASDAIVYTEQLASGATQVVQSGATFALGTHTIVAAATDTAGNKGTAAPFSFDVFNPSSTNVIDFNAGNTGGVLEIGPSDFTAGQFLPIIRNFGSSDQIEISNVSPTSYSSIDGATPGAFDAATGTTTLLLSDAGVQVATLTLDGDYQDTPFVATANGGNIEVSEVACYCAGTHILTSSGGKPVENLEIGDLLVTLNGALRPIKWIGSRVVDCTRHPTPKDVWPVSVARGAFGENQPARELWLSPGHNIAANGVLMPISALQNGKSVMQHRRSSIEYWHVELDRHDVIFAEGLAAESYLDTGNRAAFVNGGAFLYLNPDFQPKHWAETCLPLVFDGKEVERTKAALLERLVAQGECTTNDADLHILADHERIEPIVFDNMRFGFVVPAGKADIKLRSRTFIPAHIDATSQDLRVLGICARHLAVDGEAIPLNDEGAFRDGWHDLETYADEQFNQRWTKGIVRLPAKSRFVFIELSGHGHYWNEPEAKLTLFA